jgi:predicted DNA-binding transcriptional regulator AlpA
MLTVKTQITPGQPSFPQRGTFNAMELAAFLGISRATVWRWDKQGLLPRPVRFNRVVRWERWTIEEWLAAGAPSRAEWEASQSNR